MDGQAPPQAVAGAGRCGRGSQLGARGCPAPAPMGPLGCGLAQVGVRPAGELSMGPGPRVPVPGQAGPLWPELGVGPNLALSGGVWDQEEGSLLQGPLGLSVPGGSHTHTSLNSCDLGPGLSMAWGHEGRGAWADVSMLLSLGLCLWLPVLTPRVPGGCDAASAQRAAGLLPACVTCGWVGSCPSVSPETWLLAELGFSHQGDPLALVQPTCPSCWWPAGSHRTGGPRSGEPWWKGWELGNPGGGAREEGGPGRSSQGQQGHDGA